MPSWGGQTITMQFPPVRGASWLRLLIMHTATDTRRHLTISMHWPTIHVGPLARWLIYHGWANHPKRCSRANLLLCTRLCWMPWPPLYHCELFFLGDSTISFTMLCVGNPASQASGNCLMIHSDHCKMCGVPCSDRAMWLERSTRSMWPCGWAIHLNCTFYTTQSSTKRERASKNTEKDTSFRHLVEKTHCHRKHWLLPQYLKDERAGSLWVMKFVPHHPQNRWTWGCRSEKIDALGDPRPPTPTFRCTSGWLGAGIDVLGMDHPVGSM